MNYSGPMGHFVFCHKKEELHHYSGKDLPLDFCMECPLFNECNKCSGVVQALKPIAKHFFKNYII
jgi:hypothetical protein